MFGLTLNERIRLIHPICYLATKKLDEVNELGVHSTEAKIPWLEFTGMFQALMEVGADCDTVYNDKEQIYEQLIVDGGRWITKAGLKYLKERAHEMEQHNHKMRKTGYRI